MIKYFFGLLLAIVVAGPLLAQEDILKDFAESRREKKYCLYASTLRMVNLKRNEDYDDLVNHVEKLLIYRLDSTTRAGKTYSEITNGYKEIGFEEFASVSGGELGFDLVGKTSAKQDQFVGVYGDKDMVVAFYLKGKIGWGKIYNLMSQLQEMEMIDLMNLKR